jgi:hypothetical protein
MPEQAEERLRQGHEQFAALLGEKHAETQRTVRELVKLYESWGKPDEAAQWRSRLRPDR